MKPLVLVLLIIAQIQFLKAQTSGKRVSIPVPIGDLNCIYNAKFSPTQRNQFYPFSISETVKLISFRYHRRNYPIKGDSLLIDSLIEIRTLSASDINNLTDILYNNFYKIKPNYGSSKQCFFPRNAIVFYDKSGYLKESVLLCFHCDQYETSSGKINFGSNCTQKMEKLRQFFIASGIKFGTDKKIDLYPGEDPDE